MNEQADLRASGPAELVELVPYLLGFRPQESLVLVCLRGTRVVCTARADLDAVRDIDAVAELLQRLSAQARAERVLAVAFGTDADVAHEVLDMVECAAGPIEVCDLLWVSGERWESLCAQESGALGGSGAVAAEAVFLGMSVAGSRAEAVAVVDSTGTPAGWDAELASARRRVARWGRKRRVAAVERAVAQEAGQPFAVPDLATLVALVADPVTRDQALCRITRESAEAQMAAWLQAARQLPDDESCVHVLGLFGVAAWVAGEGALMVAAIERGERIRPDAGLISLLSQINRLALPPVWWEEVRAELVA